MQRTSPTLPNPNKTVFIVNSRISPGANADELSNILARCRVPDVDVLP